MSIAPPITKRITRTFTTSAGVATNVDTITATVIAPNGTISTGTPTGTGTTGEYTYDVDCTQEGGYIVHITGVLNSKYHTLSVAFNIPQTRLTR